MTSRQRALTVAVLAATACDTSSSAKPSDAGAGQAAGSASVAAMAPDTMMQRVRRESTATAHRAESLATARPRDSAKKARESAPGRDQLRDSAFGPKYEVDSMGKVRPVTPRKKPL